MQQVVTLLLDVYHSLSVEFVVGDAGDVAQHVGTSHLPTVMMHVINKRMLPTDTWEHRPEWKTRQVSIPSRSPGQSISGKKAGCV